MSLPDPLEIRPRSGLSARVNVPGSKSLSNRALPIAALARGTSTLTGGLASDDTNVMIGSLEALGCRVERAGGSWRVPGQSGAFEAPKAPLQVGNSGTTARFLSAAASLAAGPVVNDGDARLRERPPAGGFCDILPIRLRISGRA